MITTLVSFLSASSLILAVVILLWGCISYIIAKHEIPYCLSDLYYYMKDRYGKSAFSRWFSFIGCLLLPGLFFITGNCWWLAFIIVVGFFLIGYAPDFKNDKKQYRVHFTGAMISMVGTQVLVGILNPWAYCGLFVFLLWALSMGTHYWRHKIGKCKGEWWIEEIYDKGDWLWWIEISVFLEVIILISLGLLGV